MLYLVSYDLRQPRKDYTNLENALQQLGGQRVLLSEWLVVSNATAPQVRDFLVPHMHHQDGVLVTEITRQSAWMGVLLQDTAMQQFFANART